MEKRAILNNIELCKLSPTYNKFSLVIRDLAMVQINCIVEHSAFVV